MRQLCPDLVVQICKSGQEGPHDSLGYILFPQVPPRFPHGMIKIAPRSYLLHQVDGARVLKRSKEAQDAWVFDVAVDLDLTSHLAHKHALQCMQCFKSSSVKHLDWECMSAQISAWMTVSMATSLA